jgi:hypothetical protein
LVWVQAWRVAWAEWGVELKLRVAEWMRYSFPKEAAAEVEEAHASYPVACAFRNRQRAAEKRKLPLAGARFVHKLGEPLQLLRGYSQGLR